MVDFNYFLKKKSSILVRMLWGIHLFYQQCIWAFNNLDEGEPSRSYSTYEQRTTSRTFYSTYSRAKNTTKDYNNSKQDIAASSITGNDGWRTTARKGCHPSHSHPCRLSPHFSCVLSPSFDICINCTYYHPEVTTTSWVYYLYCRYVTGFSGMHNMTHCRQRTLFFHYCFASSSRAANKVPRALALPGSFSWKRRRWRQTAKVKTEVTYTFACNEKSLARHGADTHNPLLWGSSAASLEQQRVQRMSEIVNIVKKTSRTSCLSCLCCLSWCEQLPRSECF